MSPRTLRPSVPTRDEGTRCYVHLRADDLEERPPDS